MDELAIRSLIADHLGVSPSVVIDDAHFQQDLGADSLDLIELTMKLECEFGIDVSDDESEQCLTVGEALACVRLKCTVEAPAEIGIAS
jgi:acyl carrier protein